MDFFNYILNVAIAFMGLFAGLLLARISPDEAHDFKKYIPGMQLLVFVLVFLVLFKYLPFMMVFIFMILSFIFIYFFWHKREINTLDYIVFSIVFVIASVDKAAHYYVTALVFTFGILAGTLFYVLHDKPKHHKVTYGGHKHSGKQLNFEEMSNLLFKKYFFFLFLAIMNMLLVLLINNII